MHTGAYIEQKMMTFVFHPTGQQPGQVWMAAPPPPPGCPPGLEYLTQIDQILVQQQVELMES